MILRWQIMHVNFVKCEHNVKFQSAELTDGTKKQHFCPTIRNEKWENPKSGILALDGKIEK